MAEAGRAEANPARSGNRSKKELSMCKLTRVAEAYTCNKLCSSRSEARRGKILKPKSLCVSYYAVAGRSRVALLYKVVMK